MTSGYGPLVRATSWLPTHYVTADNLAATLRNLVEHPEIEVGMGDTLGHVISVLEDYADRHHRMG